MTFRIDGATAEIRAFDGFFVRAQNFLRGKIAKHAMTQVPEILAELPKMAVGKLSKTALIDEDSRARRNPAEAE